MTACLGGVLSALHAFPPEEAERLGVVRLVDFEDGASLRARTLEGLEQLRDSLPGQSGIGAWRSSKAGTGPPPPGRGRHACCTAT